MNSEDWGKQFQILKVLKKTGTKTERLKFLTTTFGFSCDVSEAASHPVGPSSSSPGRGLPDPRPRPLPVSLALAPISGEARASSVDVSKVANNESCPSSRPPYTGTA